MMSDSDGSAMMDGEQDGCVDVESCGSNVRCCLMDGMDLFTNDSLVATRTIKFV